MNEHDMMPVREAADLEPVWREPVAILYKHSPLCGLSAVAARQMAAFSAAHPEVPVYVVDVIRSRLVSRDVERQLEIRHESPQAFVLRRGEVTWHGSHTAITESALSGALAGAGQE
jgi:thioredoxin 1